MQVLVSGDNPTMQQTEIVCSHRQHLLTFKGSAPTTACWLQMTQTYKPTKSKQGSVDRPHQVTGWCDLWHANGLQWCEAKDEYILNQCTIEGKAHMTLHAAFFCTVRISENAQVQ